MVKNIFIVMPTTVEMALRLYRVEKYSEINQILGIIALIEFDARKAKSYTV